MARFTLTIEFDDGLAVDDVVYTELVASMALAEMRRCESVTIERAELHDSLHNFEEEGLLSHD